MNNLRDLYRLIKSNVKSITVMWNDFYNNRIKTTLVDDDQILIRDSDDGLKYKHINLSKLVTSITEINWDEILNVPTEFNPEAHADTHVSSGSDPVDHDTLTNFVANEHIDWTNTTENILTTGDATIGGTILADTINEYRTDSGITVEGVLVKDGFVDWDYISNAPVEAYTNATAMPEEVGGYEVGTTFTDKTMTQMWTSLLYPYQYPAFTSFVMSSQSTTLECGIYVTGGDRTFTWDNTNDTNVETDSLVIRDETNSTDLETGITDDNTESVPIGSNITKSTTPATHVWKILGTDSNTNEFTRNYTITWYSPFYYGSGAAGLNASQVQALTKSVAVKGTKAYTFNPTNQVMYFAYPKSYGLISTVLDPNSFDVTGDWVSSTVSFTNNPTDYNGVTMDYYVYEFANLVTLSDYEYTFYF